MGCVGDRRLPAPEGKDAVAESSERMGCVWQNAAYSRRSAVALGARCFALAPVLVTSFERQRSTSDLLRWFRPSPTTSTPGEAPGAR